MSKGKEQSSFSPGELEGSGFERISKDLQLNFPGGTSWEIDLPGEFSEDEVIKGIRVSVYRKNQDNTTSRIGNVRLSSDGAITHEGEIPDPKGILKSAQEIISVLDPEDTYIDPNWGRIHEERVAKGEHA